MLSHPIAIGSMVLVLSVVSQESQAQNVFRTQTFDTDPNWDGHNNRATTPPTAQVTQNFGYTTANFAGAAGDPTGEIGGLITPAGEGAYYGKVIAPLSFDNPLSASGNLFVQTAGHHTLLGFFNNSTIESGWRNPDEFVLRLQEEGSGAFKAFVDYSTGLWRAGGTSFKDGSGNDMLFATGQQYQWSISYDPNGNNGSGSYQGTISNSTIGTFQTGINNLATGRKLDGTTLTRFGLFNSVAQYDDRVGQVWVDDLSINNGAAETFAQNPNWDSLRNNTTYTSDIVRPKFNFGYSATHHAGGSGSGEMGGAIWAGDSRTQFNGTHMAYYGDRLDETLTLENHLQASGKVSFVRGASDSMMHIGFFDSTDSVRSSDTQTMHWPEDFLGVTIEGPSDEGFFFYPTYGLDPEGMGSVSTRGSNPPRIYPDGSAHEWTLDYDPSANGGLGQITVTLDGNTGVLNLAAGHKQIGAHFDRFGMITSQIDGNGQAVYFDDLTYTVAAGGPQWTRDGSGSWLDASNWSGEIPNAVGATATFGGAITANHLVYANSPVTVGTLTFDDDNTYRLGGLGSLTMQVSTGAALVDVRQGAQTINLPLIIASDTQFNVSAGAAMVISDPLTVTAGRTLTQSGAGSVSYQSTVTVQSDASISVASPARLGALALAADSNVQIKSGGTLMASGLSMDSAAKIDLHDGALIVDGGDYNAIRPKVIEGFHGGDWRGDGVTSSAAANDPKHSTALGIIDNRAAGYSEFAGMDGLNGDEILVRDTFYGDTNLDGAVNLGDFDRFLGGFDRASIDPPAGWLNGDFDYNGAVNDNDFKLFLLGLENHPVRGVSEEFFDALSGFVSREGLDVDLGAVPEPVAMGPLALAVCALLPRRRRSERLSRCGAAR
jgi:hypothetical protein